MNDTSAEGAAAKQAAQMTLFVCLDFGLRLMHPLMPFVTEELWQRLPGRAQMSPPPAASIMIAPYPEEVADWHNPSSETAMSMVKDVVHAARSIRADYNIANSLRPAMYIKYKSDDVMHTLGEQVSDINTLSRAGEISFMRDDQESPHGCCIKVINDQCSVRAIAFFCSDVILVTYS